MPDAFQQIISACLGEGRSPQSAALLTDLLRAAGLSPQSTKDRKRVKEVLARHGLSYEKMQGWSTAAYVREYPVLDDITYDRALKILMSEIVSGDLEPNLFVNYFVTQLTKGEPTD